MKNLWHITIVILGLVIFGCDKQSQEVPIADFEIDKILLKPYDTLFITSTFVNHQGTTYKWYVNDQELTNYENQINPKIIISGWKPGNYEFSLEVISASGEASIRSVVVTIGRYKIEGISLTYIDPFLWDLDSTGINANPDIQLRWIIHDEVKYVGRIYWNVQPNDLPLSVDIPNNIIHQSDNIKAWQFQFVDYDNLNKVEYLTQNNSLDRLSDSFSRESLTGVQEVFVGGWVFFKIKYRIIP